MLEELIKCVLGVIGIVFFLGSGAYIGYTHGYYAGREDSGDEINKRKAENK